MNKNRKFSGDDSLWGQAKRTTPLHVLTKYAGDW